jgi:SARP family transcriptional regulator, regulator of embCAB operon
MQRQRAIRVAVLGDLRATRQDGSDVGIEEWRTGKTRDLLRLLALNDGRPVRIDRLTDLLWPGVPSQRANNSLRTAASQIRRTLREPCVVRHPGSLVLVGVVLDAHQYTDLASKAAQARSSGDTAAVLAAARAAERLYRDDFRADDDDSRWAVQERARLQQVRHRLVCDAAEAAMQERLRREALAYATIAVEMRPLNEAGLRLRMRAHASMGETAEALLDFESYRSRLAEELGADPSPETQAVHRDILRSTEPDVFLHGGPQERDERSQ